MSTTRKIITQGHRGARGVQPENTLASFQYAFDAGVDRVEVDIVLTADDSLILVHDETTHPDLVRSDNGRWVTGRIPWYSLDTSAIRRFDVGRIRPGSAYAQRFLHQIACDGARISTFGELAEFILGRENGELNLEIKCDPNATPPRPGIPHFANRVVEAIHRFNIQTRVTVQSFNWSMVAAVRQLDPSLVSGCLTSEQPQFDTVNRHQPHPGDWTHGLHPEDFNGSLPAMVKEMGVDYWSSEHLDLNPGVIQEAHNLGLAVHCWTVNQANDMQRLISWKVDSIISDYPDTLVGVVKDYEQLKLNIPT